MLQRCLRTVVAGALVVAASAPARADEPTRIGVVVTTRVNVSAEQAQQIGADLGEALRAERPVDVIAGAEVERRLPADGLPDECVADSECRYDLGNRLDAEELLLLVIVGLGDDIQIDTTWTRVASGKVASRPQIVLTPDADRAAVFREMVPRLVPHIPKQPAKQGPDIIVVPTPGEPPAGRGKHFTTGTWIASGVAGAALIGSGIFALSAQRKFSSLDDDGCRDMGCDPSEIDSLRNHALAADVLFGVAAASAVTAVVLYVRSDDDDVQKPDAEPAGVQVGPGPGDVGVSIGGTF